jgi:hypothetical protein
MSLAAGGRVRRPRRRAELVIEVAERAWAVPAHGEPDVLA